MGRPSTARPEIGASSPGVSGGAAGPPPVATAAGVGIGSTIPDLRKVYGSRLRLHSAKARGTDELAEPSVLADTSFTTTAFDVGDRANLTLSGEFFEGRLSCTLIASGSVPPRDGDRCPRTDPSETGVDGTG